MRRRQAILGLAGLAAGSALPLRGQGSAVRVTREEPVVRRTEFDPRRPPPGMPELKPPESGVCNTTFELSASVRYSAEALSPTRARIYVDELDLTTRLSFDIYWVEGGPSKLRAHEEGHRAIGEHYYATAPAVAADIGRRLIGATFDGEGPTPQAAQRDAFDEVVGAIQREYLARVRIPSATANERYDEITRHGLEDIDEAAAIALAIGAAAGR
jgi:hypothetical protein